MKHFVVIPAYNEEEALAQTLAGLQTLPENYDILVVNDGSYDRTGAVAEHLSNSGARRLQVLHLPGNAGIGVAVQTGYLFAAKSGAYKYVIQFDADGQHDAASIVPLVEKCEKDSLDLCVGSRFLRDEQDNFRTTWPRRIGIRFFAWLIRVLARRRVTDPTSGFRCVGPRLWKRFARYYPEVYPEPESLFWCARNRYRIGELPVRMRERQGGVSSIRFSKAAYYMIKVTLAIILDRLRSTEQAGGHDEC